MARTFIIIALALSPWALAQAQECGMAQQMINWSQPNNVPINNDNATRWPIDASIRIAYSGVWCPAADEIEFVKVPKEGDPEPVPARIRIKTPYKIVTNSTDPLTIMEIDPVDDLEKRTDYRITVRPPDPRLAINREFILEFRTKVGKAEQFPEFEGVSSVKLDGNRCLEETAFHSADEPTRACPRPNRLKVAIEFQPLDRPEIAYVVYRTSSVEISEDGMGKGSGRADLTPIRIAFENGARDLIGNGPPARKTGMFVPYYPLPRRDCFSVRAIDEYGRERGDVMKEKCVDLFPLAPCPDGCDPSAEMCLTFPMPMEAEGMDAQPGQECAPVGLNGAEATDEVPDVGEEPESGGAGDMMAGPGGGASLGAGGAAGDGATASGGANGAAQDASTKKESSGGLCSIDGVGTKKAIPWILIAGLVFVVGLRRRSV